MVLRLDTDTYDEVCSILSVNDIKGEEGVTKVIAELDKIFQVDESINAYELYEQFETYRRPANVSISEYCRVFEQKVAMLQASGTILAEHVIAYRMLKSANLNDREEQLVKATISKMSKTEMTKQLKKVFNGISAESTSIKTEPIDYVQNDILYGEYHRSRHQDKQSNEQKYEQRRYTLNYRDGRNGDYSTERRDIRNREYSSGRGYGRSRGYSGDHRDRRDRDYSSDRRSSREREYSSDNRGVDQRMELKSGRNPVYNGKISRCRICDSVNHWEKRCPDRERDAHGTYQENCSDYDKSEDREIVFNIKHAATTAVDSTIVTLNSETLTSAVLDCGAAKTVW